MSRLKFCVLVSFVALITGPQPSPAAPPDQGVTAINRGVVELETSGAAGISVRIAEDLANLVDDGATRRVVPVVGKGSLQNLTDLKYLRGIDMAIVQSDVLDYAKEQKLLPGIEASMTYVTRLYNEEFHLLAGANIRNIGELANKKINVDVRELANISDIGAGEQVKFLVVEPRDVGHRRFDARQQFLLLRVIEDVTLDDRHIDAAQVFEVSQILQ